MRKFHLFIYLFAGLFIFQGCDVFSSGSDDEITASEERQFIWNGLNYWYYWQDQVPELADERKNDIPSFNQLLNTPVDEEALFNQLIYDLEDDFSWFIEDYEVHEAARLGTSKSFGFRFGLAREYGITGLETGDVFGYVQYIVPDSPADAAGLKRGDIFRGINGQKITLANYLELLDNEVYELKMANVRRNDFGYQIDDLDETVLVQSEIINENPIHTYEMYNFGSKTVGYLLYNSFRFNYHEQLNELFGLFVANGVDELVLDLRYNGGGSLLTSALLASMISGESESSIFAELRYSEKRSSNDLPFPFFKTVPIYDENGKFLNEDTVLNSLGLSRVYILASSRTASASETLINGLKPYGVDVVVIGTQTIGKDEGSITVYDAPSVQYSPENSEERSKINPNHMLAMQPIVFKIFNANGEDYPDGFPPSPGTTVQSEFNYLEGGLPPLGHQEEQLFKTALGQINGTFFAKDLAGDEINLPMHFLDSSELIPFHDDVYLLPSDMERISIDKE